VNAVGLARQAWQRLGPDSTQDQIARAVPHPGQASLVRTGVAAGATIVVLSAASAVTSAIRRRAEGS
jgi:hypothetical protein